MLDDDVLPDVTSLSPVRSAAKLPDDDEEELDDEEDDDDDDDDDEEEDFDEGGGEVIRPTDVFELPSVMSPLLLTITFEDGWPLKQPLDV